MDTSKAVTHLGLCAGYGGIELGLQRAIPSLRSIALCEIEAFAIANLVSKMEAGLMDPAPIWPDLKTFPWAAFRDRVDILTGGYPCQPFSAAGQRKGKQDPRHLWPWIADGIRLLKPKCCFFENVEGHISLGLSDVIEDLAGMGYRTTWGIFSASECGAPHQRKRVFILAVASGLGSAAGLSGSFQRHEGQSGESDDGGGQDVGNAISQGVEGAYNNGGFPGWIQRHIVKSSAWPSRPGEQQYGWEPPRVVLAHSSDNGCASGEAGGDVCGEQSDTRRQEKSASVEQSAGSDSFARLSDEVRDMADTISGWGQQAGSECGSGEVAADSGCKEGTGDQQAVIPDDQGSNGVIRQTQPPLGGDPDGPAGGLDYAELCVTCDNRTDELRLLGNGVVPATAERAFRVLIKELL
jgi:site-specific DNA-cytosine methylase